jgi:hypothetical protein
MTEVIIGNIEEIFPHISNDMFIELMCTLPIYLGRARLVRVPLALEFRFTFYVTVM